MTLPSSPPATAPLQAAPAGSYLRLDPAFLISVVVALLLFTLGVVATVRAYSPVPFWDMWDGTLGFYLNQESNPAAWWSQHNEHRMILARLLFFIDIQAFGGTWIFLQVANLVLAAATFGLVAWCTLKLSPSKSTSLRITAAVILSFTLLWPQENNITWGFQSAFYLAQLLPLAALCLLYVSCGEGRRNSAWFVLALVVAALAAGSMANGVLALWLLVAACILARQGWKRTLAAVAVALCVTFAYFHGYVTPGNPGSISENLQQAPRGVMWYLFAYVGSPFAHLVPGAAPPNVKLAVAFGGVIVLAAIYLGLTALFQRRRRVDMALVLGLFLAYLGASAFAVAASRFGYGLESAVASRYTTPALLILSAVMALGVAHASARWPFARGQAAGVLLIVPLLFVPLQWNAIKHNSLADFEKVTAAMALEMGARDDEQVLWTYPDTPRVLPIARQASERNLAIFNHPLLRDAEPSIGTTYSELPVEKCGVVPPIAAALPNEAVWSRLQGGLVADVLRPELEPLYLLDGQGHVIGRGILAVAEKQASGDKPGAPFKLYAPSKLLQPGPMRVVIPGVCSGDFNYPG